MASLIGLDESETATKAGDKVDLALAQVAQKVISELAEITADTIVEYPELGDDYVLAIIDDGKSREVRVYSRNDIIDSYEGTESEKEALRQSLSKEPLIAYSSTEGLPSSSQTEASQALADKVNQFLTTNQKLLNLLDQNGYNPFASLLAS